MEESVLIVSHNYQPEVRIEDVFRHQHCERHKLEPGVTVTRKFVVKYLQLADCREAVDECLEFTGRNFFVAYFRVADLL